MSKRRSELQNQQRLPWIFEMITSIVTHRSCKVIKLLSSLFGTRLSCTPRSPLSVDFHAHAWSFSVPFPTPLSTLATYFPTMGRNL